MSFLFSYHSRFLFPVLVRNWTWTLLRGHRKSTKDTWWFCRIWLQNSKCLWETACPNFFDKILRCWNLQKRKLIRWKMTPVSWKERVRQSCGFNQLYHLIKPKSYHPFFYSINLVCLYPFTKKLSYFHTNFCLLIWYLYLDWYVYMQKAPFASFSFETQLSILI